MMSEVYVRVTDAYNDVNGGQDDINGGSYRTSNSAFNPALGDLCATITNIADSEIREIYCQEMFSRNFVVLHTNGSRLQFCEIQVYDNRGILNYRPKGDIKHCDIKHVSLKHCLIQNSIIPHYMRYSKCKSHTLGDIAIFLN